MKILCPTDFGPRALAAAAVASELARRTGGALELFHVLPVRSQPLSDLIAEGGALDEEIRSQRREQLYLQCEEIQRAGIEATARLADGDVDAAIVERARAIDADLIVMGAHDRPALERFILGSVAERTLRAAERPVLIVPPGVEALGKVDGGGATLRVVVAHDGRPASAGAVAFIKRLRRQLPCDVTFARFYWPIEEFDRLGLTGPRDLFAADPDVTSDLTRSLSMDVGVLPGTGSTAMIVEPGWGDPAQRILEFAHEQNCDLVIMGAESRRGLASLAHPPVARRVARHATGVPILFVPQPPASRGRAEVPGLFTVLAATDLSPGADRAVPFAYSLLSAHGGVVELCLVHERTLPSPPYVYDRPDDKKLTEAERSDLEKRLRALIPKSAEQLGITTHVTIIDGGRAAEAIVQAAERLVVDSLVLGSHGRGGGARAILGSVAQDVVRHSRRPVLIVPTPKDN
ncbi:MAG TPA: universal stress protein [Polyangia bacterium]|nr:universal stress protein [Polyangia bacterium]